MSPNPPPPPAAPAPQAEPLKAEPTISQPTQPTAPHPSTPPPPPPPYIIEPSTTHSHTLILLHGLGSNGEKFGREFLSSGKTRLGSTLPQLFPGVRFVFPTSRRRRSTAFNRSLLTQWFDVARLRDPSYRKEVQLRGLGESAREVAECLHGEEQLQEMMGKMERKNIVIGGLSQGCAMAVCVLLGLDYGIGGFVGMSGFLPFREDVEIAVEDVVVGDEDGDRGPVFVGDDEEEKEQQQYEPAVRASIFERDLLGLEPVEDPSVEKTACKTPIFIGHGRDDEKIPWTLGKAMVGTLKKAGYKVEWKCYKDQGHWYKIPDQIDDLVDFLCSIVGWEVEST